MTAPVRTLADLYDMDVVEPPWLVKDLLVRGTVNILWAMSGMGKSYFALQLIVCLASGEPFLDFKIPTPGKSLWFGSPEIVKSLYYCLEGGESGLAYRIKKYPGPVTAEVKASVRVEVFLSLTTEKDFAALQEAIVDWGASLVVIDPLSMVGLPRGWDWNDNSIVAPFMSKLGKMAVETRACILLVHHKKKGPKDDTPNEEYDRTTATGAQSLVNLTSTRMHIRGMGHGQRTLYLFGKDVRAMELNIRHESKDPYGPIWKRARGAVPHAMDADLLREDMGLIRCGICGIWSTEAVHDNHKGAR